MAKESSPSVKKAGKARDYGLPPLTFEEAAKVLGLEVGGFIQWVLERVRPSPTTWANWNGPERDLPESLIRLYLTEGKVAESAYQKELRELKELVAQTKEATEVAAAEAAKARARETGKRKAGRARRTA